jgi:DNA-damage-inducible protein D
MVMTPEPPDFEAIRQISPYGKEYWSARDLMPLLGYDKWQRFEQVVERAIISCQQTGNNPDDHFTGAGKMIETGKTAKREIKDFYLSRFACYNISLNGDPRKPEIAAAQTYFIVSTRELELHKIEDLQRQQEERLEVRENVSQRNKSLNVAAKDAGVLPKNFGVFHIAGYEGMYDGLGPEQLKVKKGIDPDEDFLDNIGSEELAANLFRITQTRARLVRDKVIGQSNAIKAHREIGAKVRQTIKEMGGEMPENLPAEPSIKPLRESKKRKRKKVGDAKTKAIGAGQLDMFGSSTGEESEETDS